ncbi:MAG: Asp-tRNA(Asn)/Glu-tRNA(Gln) amidotransferase subunit GatC [Methanoregula sp.]|nr:MAG: Asp-tRNA(Asn)/Glu-tRNA(Gln) amidotransferase subunit GatC [Methanoregula sp.]
MVTEKEVQHIAGLADIGINTGELGDFTARFNEILDYFDVLDRVQGDGKVACDLSNVMRDDIVEPSLLQEDALKNAAAKEDGFVKAPRVM